MLGRTVRAVAQDQMINLILGVARGQGQPLSKGGDVESAL